MWLDRTRLKGDYLWVMMMFLEFLEGGWVRENLWRIQACSQCPVSCERMTHLLAQEDAPAISGARVWAPLPALTHNALQ